VDVDNDGFVAPIDALLVINYLFAWLPLVGNNPIPLPPREPEFSPPVPVLDPTGGGLPGEGRFIDVNGDGFLTPSDAFIVINFLNNPPAPAPLPEGEGEGEAPEAPQGSSAPMVGGSSKRSASGLDSMALLVSPDVVIEERSLDTAASSTSLLTAVQLAGDESLNLAALAAVVTPSGDEIGQALRLTDQLDQDLPIGPLDEAAWNDLLGDLAIDAARNKREPKQAR
jgi:hypothetical protein